MSTPEKTIVIFRRWRSDPKSVIAFFPEIPSDANGYRCESFMHMGQHSGADFEGCVSATKPVSKYDPEVVALMRELTGRGYNLEVRKVGHQSYRAKRLAEARRLRESAK